MPEVEAIMRHDADGGFLRKRSWQGWIELVFLFLAVLLLCGCGPGAIPASPEDPQAQVQRYIQETLAAQTRVQWAVEGTMAALAGPTPAAGPTPTAGATSAGSAPVPAQPGCTDRAEFVSETIADNTVFASAEAFTQTWVLRNSGSCTWTTGYSLVLKGGEPMGELTEVNMDHEVPPGSIVEISVERLAPVASGEHRQDWILKNAAGGAFGVGGTADQPVWLQIVVEAQAMAVPEPEQAQTTVRLDVPAMGGGPGSDVDEDGLDDGFEGWIANAFRPYLYFEGDEKAGPNTIMRFYQVTPVYKTSPNIWNFYKYQFPEYQGPPGILITYVVAYTDDYGFAVDIIDQGIHDGDTEMMRIFLVNSRTDPYVWYPATVIIKRHEDPPEFYYPEKIQWMDGSHPRIWVSQDKHAMYSSESECNGYLCPNFIGDLFGGCLEQCGSSWTLSDEIIQGVNGFNVGEREKHPFSQIPSSSLGLFTSEFAWSNDPLSFVPYYDNNGKSIGRYDRAGDFCGGKYGSYRCGGGMDSKWWPMSDPKSQAELAYKLSQYADRYFTKYFGPQYRACFETAVAAKAGTDLHLNLTLSGTAHSQTFYDLDNSDDNFERGGIDCFEVGAYPLEEKITGLTLYLFNDINDDSEWLLKSVLVTDLFSGEIWHFNNTMWLDYKSGYDPTVQETTTGPEVALQPNQ
jgi:hypothetical protein